MAAASVAATIQTTLRLATNSKTISSRVGCWIVDMNYFVAKEYASPLEYCSRTELLWTHPRRFPNSLEIEAGIVRPHMAL